MIKYIKSFFFTVEKPTMNPNHLSPIPNNKFFEEVIDKEPNIDDEPKSQKQQQQLKKYFLQKNNKWGL